MTTKFNKTYHNTTDISNEAKSVSEAVQTRHSIRDFKPDSIPLSMLKEILEKACRSPSMKNSQPWKIHLATGDARNSLAAHLTKVALKENINPDVAFPQNYPPNIKKRMFALGMNIYSVAGIDRKDKCSRDHFLLRNFNFFNAPAVIFISSTCPPSTYVGIDIGCFLATFMLLAKEKGLGTCAQLSLASFPHIIRKELNIPGEELLLLGVSIGYPNPDSDLNNYHTEREDMPNIVTIHN